MTASRVCRIIMQGASPPRPLYALAERFAPAPPLKYA
jgi:hypothetical protein